MNTSLLSHHAYLLDIRKYMHEMAVVKQAGPPEWHLGRGTNTAQATNTIMLLSPVKARQNAISTNVAMALVSIKSQNFTLPLHLP
jgi:hypothetical protein